MLTERERFVTWVQTVLRDAEVAVHKLLDLEVRGREDGEWKVAHRHGSAPPE